METIDEIPISKVHRASKIIQTGVKVGVNYLRYYGDKLSKTEVLARERLDDANADDIYDGLKNLKGSALKVAQMLSMEKNILPKAYVDRFSLSQFSVPPLSAALVVKTFRDYFGKAPSEIFDTFDANAMFAASIGQVHRATKDGRLLAVKIQYPGVSDSISSDLALIKPLAMKMFNIKGKGSEVYFAEVEEKLLEETNYIREVEESVELAEACSHLPNLRFPRYFQDLSSQRIITMDWMEGRHLSEFAKTNKDEDLANNLGQTLWDFYMFQIHHLKKFHADPHPGNFLVDKSGKLIVLDFGCVKTIPKSFYDPYFELAQKDNLEDPITFRARLRDLQILKEGDTDREIEFFQKMFHELLSLFTRPFHNDVFDFSDEEFFGALSEIGERYYKNNDLRNMNANRGSRHFIYVNRTFFGLFSLLHELKATRIRIADFIPIFAKA